MVPWIQVYSNLVSHPKTYALSERLNFSCSSVNGNIIAAGMLVGLWSWAAQNASNGDLTACPARVLADAAGWCKKPDAFIEALVLSRWIDRGDSSLCLHDWEEYASLLMEQIDNQKARTRERVKRYREQQKLKDASPQKSGDVTLHKEKSKVTETLSNAYTIQDRTVHNPNTPVYQMKRTEERERNQSFLSDEKMEKLISAYSENGWTLSPQMLEWRKKHQDAAEAKREVF